MIEISFSKVVNLVVVFFFFSVIRFVNRNFGLRFNMCVNSGCLSIQDTLSLY